MSLQAHFWAYIQGKEDLKGYMRYTVYYSTVYNSQDMEAA